MGRRGPALLVCLFALTGCGDETADVAPGADGGPATRQVVDGASSPDVAFHLGGAPDPDAAVDPEPDPDGDVAPPDDPDMATDPPEPPPDVPQPPPMPAYSHGECPALVGGPTADTSRVLQFPSGDQVRSFRLIVPERYDGTEAWPVVFAWHWLNASSSSFVRDGELDTATDQMGFIAVVPDSLRNENGDRSFLLSWPFAEVWGIEPEVVFFDDMLACVTRQLNVDPKRIYGIGVSAGGLWLTYLSTTARANYFAAIEILSGGLGDMLGVWRMEYAPTERKFPAVVLWGGPADWLALSFQDASIRYRDELLADGHFVVECTHDAGHGIPPIDPPEGQTRFTPMWTFMLDHPYDVPPGTSPYLDEGLPDSFPEWCRIAGE